MNNTLSNCITSAMIGDAVGFHVECAEKEAVQKLVKLVRTQQKNLSFQDLLSFELKDWITGRIYKSGQITDDSQSMLALVYAFFDNEKNPYEIFAKNMLKLFKSDEIVAYGHTTKNAIMRYEKMGNLKTTGDQKRITNGAAMRVAPLGVLYKDDKEKLIKASCLQSQVTHAHPIAQLSSLSLATAVACAANGHIKHMDIMASIMSNFLQAQKIFSFDDEHIEKFIPFINHNLENLEQAKSLILKIDKIEDEQDYGISTYAPTCVFWSIYCFCLNKDNFWNCLADSISIGGDTDTVATMSCAIHGAYQKSDGLERFSNWLHNHGKAIRLPQI